jgi:(p)ppGpp synthase/HD superfamily hydrolase
VGLLHDITSIISGTGTNILQVQLKTGGSPRTARATLTVEVKSLTHLSSLMDKLNALSDVLRVERARGS